MNPRFALVLVLASVFSSACSPPPASTSSAAEHKAASADLPPVAKSPAAVPTRAPIQMLVRSTAASALTPAVWQGGQWRLAVNAGETFAFCVRSAHSKPLVLAISIQGQNVDLGPAHPTRPLWRLDPQAGRCFPDFIANDQRPMAVAWRAFEADGQDGSWIEDAAARPLAEGMAVLGSGPAPATNALWPGLVVVQDP